MPKILIIQIKRFRQGSGSSDSSKSGFFNMAYAQICQQEKVEDHVDFPINGLDISQHVKSANKEGLSTVYDLYAVVNHYGVLNGGHYTAFSKKTNGQWFNYNDETVTRATEENVCTRAAYLLFYRRRENPSKPCTGEPTSDEVINNDEVPTHTIPD